ncbi:MAG: decarboxylase [Nanoarchaeota archaeon]
MKAKFVISKKKVLEQYNIMKKYADIVSYSHKTNIDIGKILENNADSMFSIHTLESLTELKGHKKVWFFSQAWCDEDIGLLFEKGVNKFVVDNDTDLKVLLDYIKKNNKKIWLLLRMRLQEHTVHTGKHYVYGFYSSRVNDLLPELRKNKNIEKLGIHFHRKTQNVSEWGLKEELEGTIKHWGKIDLVNIGGGLPAEYKNFRQSVLKSIFEKITELKKWLNKQGIKMIIEPGRFIAASPVKLETEILNVIDNNIIINCSVYNSAMDTFVAHIRLLVEGEKEKGDAYTIKGCTPDSMDIFRYRVFLEKPKKGEKITFLNAGAYNYASDFCNLPKLETIVVD